MLFLNSFAKNLLLYCDFLCYVHCYDMWNEKYVIQATTNPGKIRDAGNASRGGA